jgi:hypothetical protein
MAYNWGMGNVDAFLSGRKTIADVPKETAAYVQAVEGVSINSIPTHGGTVDVTGVTNTSVVSDAIAKANTVGTAAGSSANAAADVKLYTAALAELSAQGTTSGADVDKLSQALQKSQIAFQDAIQPAQKMLDTMSRQTAGNDLVTASYVNGFAAVDHATNAVKAEEQARGLAAVGTAQYAAIVDALTASYDRQSASQQNLRAAQAGADQKQQLDYLQAELSTLNETGDVRARDLAVFREQQEIAKSMPDIDAARRDALLANAAAIADATSQLQRQQQASQELGNMLTQAFDQVGSAITQAFVQGNGAAVNFGNIARAVMASVLQEVVKLAIINPILNSVAGGTQRTTLSDVFSLGGSSGSGTSGASGVGGIGNLLSLGSTASSVSGALGGPSIGSALGLTGNGGLLSGVGSSVTGFLNTSTGIGATGLGGIPVEGAYNAAQVGASGGAGASIGSLAGGAGLGFGAGSLVGGYLQSSMGKTGPAPTIGAAGGAIAGAIIGSALPVVGTVLGGLIGGLVGGAGGSLIGPHIANSYSSQGLAINNGQFVTGARLAQRDENAAAEQAQGVSDTNSVNAFLAANKLILTSLGKISQLGDNTPGGFQDPSKAADLNSAFPNFRFSSSDPIEAEKLADKSFGSADEFQAWVNTFNAVQASAKAYLTDTTAIMKDLGVTSGALTDNVAALNAAYANDKTAMDGLLASGDLSTQQTLDLTAAEDKLAAIRDKSIQAVTQSVIDQYTQTDAGLTSRYLNALGSVTGSSAVQQSAQLYSFDAGADQQRRQLSDALVQTFGDSVKGTEGYVAQMATLEKTLGEERLAIQQSFNDKITATASGSVTSITSYLNKLQTGSGSLLSPGAQYGLASSQFDAVAGAAKAGDFNSYSNITGYADTFLQASQAMNGSGSAYVADFSRVLSALSDLATVTPDALTQQVYVAEMQTQTQTLIAGLGAVQAEVATLRLAISQGSAAPARLAA